MNQVTKAMKGVVKGMDKGLASMDVDKISAIMDKFEHQFEDLDVKAAYMDQAMNTTTAASTPADQVDDLVKMVADENNLELGEAFSDLGPVGKIKVPEKKKAEVMEDDSLEQRLANLRG
jgi:charged multivesicular body protein 1